MLNSVQQVITQHGSPEGLFVDRLGVILPEQKQILLHIRGNRLPEQQQGAFNAQLITENGRCQSMIGADSSYGDQVPGLSLPGFGQNKFKLSDLITAVDR